MKKPTFVILIVLLPGLLGLSLWQLAGFFMEYREGTQSYAALEQYISVPESAATESAENTVTVAGTEPIVPSTEPETEKWPVVDFSALREINPDVVGWILIEGTDISYPVVQGTDNDYYLNHLMDGETNRAGTVFLDARVSGDFSAKNNVIYGHYMKNGSMFTEVARYKTQSFYDEHPAAMLLTPEGNYKIRFFSGYVVSDRGDAWDYSFTEESYVVRLRRICQKSGFASDIVPDVSDRILTLSTCSYEYENARFVLHGIMIG